MPNRRSTRRCSGCRTSCWSRGGRGDHDREFGQRVGALGRRASGDRRFDRDFRDRADPDLAGAVRGGPPHGPRERPARAGSGGRSAALSSANAWVLSAVVLVVIGGLIASAETALTRISRVRTEEFLREGRRGAKRLRDVVADPPRYLNLLLLLRLSCELISTVIVTLLFIDLLGDQGWAYAAAAALMILVSYVIVGVSPRTLGRQHAEPIALASAPIVYGLTRIFGPLPQLLILLGNALTPGKGFREGP